MPLSKMTAAILDDLHYVVDASAVSLKVYMAERIYSMYVFIISVRH